MRRPANNVCRPRTQFEPRRFKVLQRSGTALGLALLFLGCRTPRDTGALAEDPAQAAFWSDAAVERRIQAHAHYGASVLAELAGEDQAVVLDHLRQAALADPGQESLVLKVADRMLRGEAFEQAVAFLQECLRTPRAPASYYARLGLAYARQGLTAQAVEANRAALDRDPSFLLAYQNLIRISSQAGEPTQVLAIIREAARQTSLDPGFFLSVAGFYFAYERSYPDAVESLREEAKKTLDQARALDPEDPILLALLAEGYKRLGEVETAEAVYRKWVDRYPQQTMAWESLADLYLYSGNREEAAELLRKLVELQPEHRRATYMLGSLALEEGQLEEAEEFLKRAITLQPDLKPAYYRLAAVQLSRAQPESALSTLNRARDLFQPSDFVLEFYSGLAHASAERWAEAVKRFTEAEIIAVATDPEALTDGFYFQFGAASERLGDYEGSARLFRKCLELRPDFAEALNYLGYMWAERGENLAEARRLIERAVELEPENAAFLDSLGWVLFRQNKPEEALPWLEKAVDKVDAPDPTLFDHLGDIYHALGRRAEAREAWQRALDLQPTEAVAEKLKGEH